MLETFQQLSLLLQHWIDNLRNRPWVVFLLIACVWGTFGWREYIRESKAHADDNRACIEANTKATDLTIQAQKEAMSAKDRLIENLLSTRDTTSNAK